MTRQGDRFARDVFPVELEEIRARRENVLGGDGGRDAGGVAAADGSQPAEGPHAARGLTGLALSGGGIRSASLCLGVMQAFARADGKAGSRRGILRFFDYLSTVSGGGCIGSTLSAAMTTEDAEPDGENFPLRFAPGEEGKPGAVVHLRNNSNWVAPTGSLDRLRLAAVVLRGILLNILLSLPALMVMVFLTEILQELRIGAPLYRVLAVLAVASFAAVILTFPMMSRMLMASPTRALTWRGRNRYELLTTLTLLVTLASAALVPVFILIGHARLATWEQFRLSLVRTLRNPFGFGHSLGWVVLLLVVVAFLLAARAHGAVSRLSGRLGILLLGILGPGILFGIYLLLCVLQIDSPYVGADPLAAVTVTEAQFDQVYVEFLTRVIEERADAERRCRAKAAPAKCPDDAARMSRELSRGNSAAVLAALTDPRTGTIPVLSDTLCSPGFRERATRRGTGWLSWLLDRSDPARPSTLDRLCVQVDDKLRLADRLSIEILPGAAADVRGGRRDVWRLRTPAADPAAPDVAPEAILRVTSFVSDRELSVAHDYEEELAAGIFSAGLRDELRIRGLLACRGQEMEVRVSPLYRHRWWIGPPCATPDWAEERTTCPETAPAGCAEGGAGSWRQGYYLVKEGGRLRFDPAQPADLFDREGGLDYFFWGAFVALLALVALVNVNLTSSHDFFRDRMSRAFLIRRRRAGDGGASGADRRWRPEPCTGCGLEGCGMELMDDLKLSQLNPYHSAPYHLINATLNLEGSGDLGLRGRNADFFVFTQRYVGGARTGYCPTAIMEMVDPHLNLGTAMAISGAGAAPNAGYTTVRPLIFVLALLNVRLGYWLAHPGRVLESTLGRFRASSKDLGSRLDVKSRLKLLGEIQRFRAVGPAYLVREAMGSVNESQPCVNLSDGGHLENLGIYELLRRRCKLIVAVDAEEDAEYGFGGLLRLVRFARIDLGVEIEIRLDDLRPHPRRLERGRASGGEERLADRHWTVARIRYGEDEADTGYLVYIKSTLTGDESEDVLDYADRNETFPQEPSSDQFYTEEQFEAYRSLGYHVGEAVAAELKELFEDGAEWLAAGALEELWRRATERDAERTQRLAERAVP